MLWKAWAGFILALSTVAQAQSIIIISAPLHEMQQGIVHWEDNHNPPGAPDYKLTINLPSIEVYDSDGTSVYYSAGDATANAKFLATMNEHMFTTLSKRALPHRPSFSETLAMYPELSQSASRLIHGKLFSVVCLTYPNWEEAQPQNIEVRRLQKTGVPQGAQLIEIDLDYKN